jgi:hypothetical protein
MQPTTTLKIIGTGLTLALVANLLLASFRLYNWMVFWIVLIVIAALSYWGVPWWKRRYVVISENKSI